MYGLAVNLIMSVSGHPSINNEMVPQVELFSFVLLEEMKTPKRHFEINRPLDGRKRKKKRIFLFNK